MAPGQALVPLADVLHTADAAASTAPERETAETSRSAGSVADAIVSESLTAGYLLQVDTILYAAPSSVDRRPPGLPPGLEALREYHAPAWLELCLQRSRNASGDLVVRLGMPLLDRYLDFLAVRSRPNTFPAAAYDLKVFFTVVGKAPHEVTSADVLGFVTAQHTGGGPGRLQPVAQGAVGVSARTVRRRLSSVSGLFGFLLASGDVEVNPVPRGLPTRRERQRPRQGVPLVRTPRTLPRILEPAAVDALLATLRTYRDRAMVEAMVLGGLRRCEVLGCGWAICRSRPGGCSSARARAAIIG